MYITTVDNVEYMHTYCEISKPNSVFNSKSKLSFLDYKCKVANFPNK